MILGIAPKKPIIRILLISLLVTGIAYLIKDLFLLPDYENLPAKIFDLGLSFLTIYYLNEYSTHSLLIMK